ncbi:MAG: alpha/beta hydrolase, partial [Myxococcales bacterium]
MSSANKSTIVRSVVVPVLGQVERGAGAVLEQVKRRKSLVPGRVEALGFVRGLGWKLLSVVAPERAERDAADLFRQPTRSGVAGEPFVPCYAGKRFSVETSTGVVAAWQFGEGQGPTVLVAHGWNGAAAQLFRLIARLVRGGFEVVAFDQPAHGLSGGTRTDVADMADAVRSVAFRVRPVHAVVAHSLGATAAALAIARGAAIPRAVLIAPPVEVPYFARGFARRLGLPPARAEGMLRKLAEVTGPVEALDLRQLAPRQRAALLVLHDLDDREVPFAHGEALASAWPGARLRSLQNLGHRRMLREPFVLDEIVDFLR